MSWAKWTYIFKSSYSGKIDLVVRKVLRVTELYTKGASKEHRGAVELLKKQLHTANCH